MNHAKIRIRKLIIKRCTYFYPPQGKAMFLEACVSHSVHRGRGSPLWTETPRQKHPQQRHPQQRHPPTETPGQRPRGQRPSAATAAVVPIGMHSCIVLFLLCFKPLKFQKFKIYFGTVIFHCTSDFSLVQVTSRYTMVRVTFWTIQCQ